MRIEVEPGFALSVRRLGTGLGTPVVLLHGFTGSSAAWGAFGELLGAGCTVLAVDIVGHGASDAPKALDHYRMAAAADDVVGAMAESGLQRATVLGYSMGGRLALHIAAAYPEAVERLVLIGASPGIEGEADRLVRVAADEVLAAQIERDGVERFIDYWEGVPLFETQRRLPDDVRAAIRAGRLKNSATGLANSLRGMGAGAQQPLHDRLPSLKMAALLLAGEADTKYTTIAAEMAARMPLARAVVIPGAGHAVHIEQAERSAAEVIGFLAAAGQPETEGAIA